MDTEPSNTSGQAVGSASTAPKPENPSPRTKDDRQFRLNLLIFWLGVMAAIIAAVAVGFPGWQNYIAQEEAKLQLRAYIDVRAKGIAAIEEGAVPRVHDTFYNIGRTPAYDNGSSSHLTVADYPPTKKLVNDECSHARADPKANKWFVGKVARPETVRETPFTAEEVEAIKAGKAAIYFHGRVCYRDIF